MPSKIHRNVIKKTPRPLEDRGSSWCRDWTCGGSSSSSEASSSNNEKTCGSLAVDCILDTGSSCMFRLLDGDTPPSTSGFKAGEFEPDEEDRDEAGSPVTSGPERCSSPCRSSGLRSGSGLPGLS